MGRCVLSERLASALRVVGTLCAVACVLACTFVDIVLVLECSVSSELGSVSFCVFRVQRVGFRVLLRLSGVAWVGSRVSVSFCCSTGLFASVRVLPFGVGASRSYLIHSFIHSLASRVTEASTPSMKKVGSHRMVVVASVLNFNIRDALRVFLWLVASSDAARLVRQSGIWEVVRVCRLAPPGRMCREDACIDL